MQDNSPNILCTTPLVKRMLQDAVASGLHVDVIPFIKTEGTIDESKAEMILQLSDKHVSVVFTSKNAVIETGRITSGNAVNWSIYCVGEGTKKEAEKQFGKEQIAGKAQNGSELADVIIANGDIKSVVFFCGNKRWHEFPEKLKDAHIASREIVVYNTTESPVTVNKKYNAILFFSPSGVESFFGANKIPAETVLFAIGKTTERAIKNTVPNETIVSDTPLKQAVIETVVAYYKKKTLN